MSNTIIGSVAAVLVTAILCGSILYGCVNNNQQFYRAMSECVSAGGSAVPTNTAGAVGSLVCVRK